MLTGEMSYDEVIVYFRKPSADIDGAVFDLHLIVRLYNGLLILLFIFFFLENSWGLAYTGHQQQRVFHRERPL